FQTKAPDDPRVLAKGSDGKIGLLTGSVSFSAGAKEEADSLDLAVSDLIRNSNLLAQFLGTPEIRSQLKLQSGLAVTDLEEIVGAIQAAGGATASERAASFFSSGVFKADPDHGILGTLRKNSDAFVLVNPDKG